MASLEHAREIINRVDSEMLKLFEERMNAVKEVAEYKKAHGIPVDDFVREEEMIKRNSKLASDEFRSYYVNFLRSNIDISKRMQHKLLDGMRVAFSGVTGAFANIAAEKIFPDAQIVPCPDFKSAYRAVENGDCDAAILPVENSQNGDVGGVMDLAFFGSLFVNGIYEAEIVQNLIAPKGADLSTIKTVISHPQALGQCAAFIEKHGYETVDAVNTAVAAEQVAKLNRIDTAAIGSAEACEKFGLVKIESHINEASNNTTRFAVFSRSRRTPSPKDRHFIMLFTVKNEAGSLGRAISVIGEHGFNLKALKSRPTKELIWDYYFYAEGEGDLYSPNGEAMKKALKESCSNFKVLGTFEKEIKI